MGAVLAFTHQLVSVTCSKCGIEFAMPQYYRTKRLEDRETFYCPNGHGQHFTGESEAQRLRRELDAKQQALDWEKNRRADAEKTISQLKGKVTKAKNKLERVANGVCPCCNRTFQNLMRHMATKHPEFKDGPTENP
jgi:protein-arginine kinase activator protein McsA